MRVFRIPSESVVHRHAVRMNLAQALPTNGMREGVCFLFQLREARLSQRIIASAQFQYPGVKSVL